MSGNPIPFSEDEKTFILKHQGPGPEHLSWGDIARELNKRYPVYNKGKRNRDSIYNWTLRYIEQSRVKTPFSCQPIKQSNPHLQL